MAWLRIDDGFATHPKLLELSYKQRWAWIEILCYCAQHRTCGKVPERITFGSKTITKQVLESFHSAGLLDRDSETWFVHDWDDYNRAISTNADRQRRYRLRNASRNGDVTDNVTRYVSEDVTSRARTPSPSKDGTALQDAARPPTPKRARSSRRDTLQKAQAYTNLVRHEYPDLTVLADEIRDRYPSLTTKQIDALTQTEPA